MTNFSQKIMGSAAQLLPFRWLAAGNSMPVLLPFYHVVTNEELPWKLNYNYPSVAQFEAELDSLLRYFKPVSLADLQRGADLKGCFHLSFDDGLRECAEIIAPVLKRKGIPATFFINPSFVDNADLFHRYKASVLIELLRKRGISLDLQHSYADLPSLDEMAEEFGLDWNEWLATNKPYMSLDQLKALQADGFTIGSHSMDHPEFELLDEENQLEEIRESMDWVNQHLHPSIKAFAFPFTDFGVSDDVIETAHREQLVDLTFGTAGLKDERIAGHYQRLPMETPENSAALQKLKTEFLAYRCKRLLGKNQARRF